MREDDMRIYLEGEGHLHEHSEPPTHDNMDRHGWAYDIAIEELPQILVALDKYRVPPIMMSEWFSLWFKFKFPYSVVQVHRLGEDPVQKLMILLVATHKFDHAKGFHLVTSELRETVKDIRPLDLPLCQRFPGLKDVLTPHHNLMELLNGKQFSKYKRFGIYNIHEMCTYKEKGCRAESLDCTWEQEYDDDRLCIDCFNASLYPFKVPRFKQTGDCVEPVVPLDLKMWGERNFMKMLWNVEERFPKRWYEFGCRTRHGPLIFKRSWVGEWPEMGDFISVLRSAAMDP
ncbi:hypothetical protein F4820DRAFT_418898 [Hypoxylon rubiginosum]|uniref:Uncharacterized protein n=1 Tax=Hypoxylon rubiginosum TaxID=110542 RepID=A0ACB9Z455_9PEZI|nr:hypothetical protein F4820DRAFT_418898 [Hypoxylon rubiginosum]